MTGDARKKGGHYSTNPATIRTRAYNASLTPEKAEARKKRFAEYRALRDACIVMSKTKEYKDDPTRDAKLHLLRKACNDMIARRTAKNIAIIGLDIEEFVTRFHDGRWHKEVKSAQQSRAQATTPKTGVALLEELRQGGKDGKDDKDDGDDDGIPDDMEAALAMQEDEIVAMKREQEAQAAQMTAVTNQVLHLTEVITALQAREVVEDRREAGVLEAAGEIFALLKN